MAIVMRRDSSLPLQYRARHSLNCDPFAEAGHTAGQRSGSGTLKEVQVWCARVDAQAEHRRSVASWLRRSSARCRSNHDCMPGKRRLCLGSEPDPLRRRPRK
jgi:hypothetical protein